MFVSFSSHGIISVGINANTIALQLLFYAIFAPWNERKCSNSQIIAKINKQMKGNENVNVTILEITSSFGVEVISATLRDPSTLSVHVMKVLFRNKRKRAYKSHNACIRVI